jgi:hypothetical protein
MTSKLAPIVLFVYDRPWHTTKTIEALKSNKLAEQSDLFVFSDGPKDDQDTEQVSKVRKFVKTISGFRTIKIIKRDQNLGLANSIIDGVNQVIQKCGRVIVLEDDIITSPTFLTYMNKLLDKYEDNQQVYSITGYNFPKKLISIPDDYPCDIYFSPRAGSWSWATWKNRWQTADWEVKDFNEFINNKEMQKQFNRGGDDMTRMLKQQMDGKIDSWAIRWCYTLFKNDAWCIYPTKSYVNNIGLDGSGVHCGKSKTKKYQHQELNRKINLNLPSTIIKNEDIILAFREIYQTTIFKKITAKIKLFIRNTYEQI